MHTLFSFLILGFAITKLVSGQLYTNESENFYYYFDSSNTISWQNAEQACINDHGTLLASVHSSSDENEIFAYMHDGTYNFYWIGLNDIRNESGTDGSISTGTWKWSDDSPTDFEITWAPGEPNMSGDEDCAWYQEKSRANDASCTSLIGGYICGKCMCWYCI